MRMWMVNPAFMCRKHILGEHVEIHMLVGSINKRKSISGYIIPTVLLELRSIQQRHLELSKEMTARGYNHKSEIQEYDLGYLPNDYMMAVVDTKRSFSELMHRCPGCRELYNKRKRYQ